MREVLLVFFGGGLGSVARYLVNLNITRVAGWTFPLGVMVINITGSFLMGLVAAYFVGRYDVWSEDTRLFLATGILGGYTTFSAYSLDAANLIERGELALAGTYVAGSVILSIFGLFCGLWAMRAFN
jgi:CrcB protein